MTRNSQHLFVKNRSCKTSLFFSDRVTDFMNKGKILAMKQSDFSKSLDTAST